MTAAPATTTPAPAAPQTLLTLSANGSEDSASFTVPAGSGNWKIEWTYSEGSFGQSVNFQIWSEDYSANVNKLGTGGSGTEYVYGDPGTGAVQNDARRARRTVGNRLGAQWLLTSGATAILPACCAICPPGTAEFRRIAALKLLLSLLT